MVWNTDERLVSMTRSQRSSAISRRRAVDALALRVEKARTGADPNVGEHHVDAATALGDRVDRPPSCASSVTSAISPSTVPPSDDNCFTAAASPSGLRSITVTRAPLPAITCAYAKPFRSRRR